MDRFDQIWKDALESYKNTLGPEKVKKMLLVPDLDSLLARTKQLNSLYADRRIIRAMNRADPFLATIHAFSEVVKVFLQADPRIFALVWGSICLILELSARHSRALNRIIDAFESFDRAFQRFRYYIQIVEVPGVSVTTLNKALIDYYAEVIGICQDAVSFCTQRSLSNLLVKPFDSSYEEKTRKREKKLKTLTTWVDIEASVLIREVHHREVLAEFQESKLSTRHRVTMHVLDHPFHNIPYTRNPEFHARHNELSRLEICLQPGLLPAEQLVMGLYGPGGIGKTEIALEYAHRHQKCYEAILWVAAETSTKLSESFSSLSGELGLVDESVQNTHQRCEALKKWLGATTHRSSRPCRWLIIFDNVEDSGSLRSFWPVGSHGAVILTSRSPEIPRQFGGQSAAIEVFPLCPLEGHRLLLRLATDREHPASQEEERAAEVITNAVGNIPLAVAVIGNFIHSAGISLKQFLETQPDFERTFLFDEDIQCQHAKDYDRPLVKAWGFNDLTETSPRLQEEGKLLIEMLSFLDPDGIPLSLFMSQNPEEMLCEGPDLPGEMPHLDQYLDSPLATHSRLDRAISTLIGRSMVMRKQGADSISCHRVIQIVVLNSMSRSRRENIFYRLQFHLNGVFPQQGDGEPLHAQWKRCEKYASQVIAVMHTYTWIKDDVPTPILLCEVAGRCAWFYFERGDMMIAQALAANAISICDNALLLNNHPGYSSWYVRDLVSHLYNVQASIAYETGRTLDSLDLHMKIKTLRVTNVRAGNGDDEKWLAASDGNVAVSLMAEGKPNEALPLILGLLDRPDMKPNEDVYLNNACVCSMLLGDYSKALEYGSNAMAAVQRLRGAESAQMAISLFYTGSIYYKQGLLDEAFDALSQCLRIRRTLLPEHSYTGLTLHKIGIVVQARGDIASSIDYFVEALHILENCEYQTGAACRSAFAVSKSYTSLVDEANALKYERRGLKLAADDERTAGFGTSPDDYDALVGFSHR